MDIVMFLDRLAEGYPSGYVPFQKMDSERSAFHVDLVIGNRNPKELEVMDIGGSVGLVPVGCAALGCKRAVVVDDFRDPVHFQFGDSTEVLKRHGVEIVNRDVIHQGISDLGTFDAISSFDSMEHWHHSPKRLFEQVMNALKPGGRFVLGVPNCVNLRKRITGLFGKNKWSSMQDWYETPVFRGHVREPDVDDLKYIARDMGLVNIQIGGKNWLGYRSKSKAIRMATIAIDPLIRDFPTLCSDIYLVGNKSHMNI
jgi:SAM-dependent methyltransferase